MNLSRYAVPVVAIMTIACASASKESGTPSGAAFWLRARSEKVPFSRVINATADQTAKILATTFADMGYPGSFAKGTNVFVTRQFDVKGRLYEGELNSAYFDCGHSAVGSVVADEYTLSFVVAAHLEPATNTTTQVEVLLDASARALTQSGTALPCRGTGKLENLILAGLAARVK
jgi:hypothetical protein